MNHARFGIALVLVLLAPSLVTAQTVPAIDVELVQLVVAPQPIVERATLVNALVRNPSTTDVYVRVDFAFANGTPLANGTLGSTNARLVPAGATLNVSIPWYPSAAQAGPAALVATATAAGDSDSTNNAASASVFVQAPAWSAWFDAPTNATLLPGGTTLLRFHARNLGNANDTPSLAFTPENASWLLAPLDLPREVAPGAEAVGDLLVQGGDDNRTNVTVRLRVGSSLDPPTRANASSVALRVDADAVNQTRRLVLDPLPATAQVFPDESLVLDATLRNAGAADVVVNLSASVEPAAGWNATLGLANASALRPLDEGNATAAVGLRAGESRVVKVRVARASSEGGAARLSIVASLRDEALLATLVPDAARADAGVDLLDAQDDVRLAALDVPAAVYAGDNATLIVRLANAGRVAGGPGNVSVRLVDGGRELGLWNLPFGAVAPGAQANLTLAVPTSELRGSFDLAARVLGANSTQPERHALLHVRLPSLALLAPDAIPLAPGSELNLTGARGGLALRLAGEDAENVTVKLDSDASWLRASWSLAALPGAQMPLALHVATPAYPHASRVEGVLRAWIPERPEVAAQVPVAFVLVDEDGPDVLRVELPARAEVGKTATLAVVADDATGIADAQLVVKLRGGASVSLPLTRAAGVATRFEANFTPVAPGAYVVEARLVDATPAAHATRATGYAWNVSAQTYAGLELQGAKDGGVLAARQVKLVERDADSTASVEVDTGGGYRPLAPPYDVRLDGWSDGEHALRVRATSLEGASWNATWTLRLDTTPPLVDAGEAKPQPDGRVALALAAQNATRAQARFHTPSGDVAVALAPVGARRFEALAVPPSSWTGVALIAQDEAGNSASTEIAGPVARAPGVELGVALVALAALALAWRKK